MYDKRGIYKTRLKNQAVASRKTMQEVLTAYGLERTVFRLSVSEYMERFTLKGGVFLYALFDGEYARVTRDIDLLAKNMSNMEPIIIIKKRISWLDYSKVFRLVDLWDRSSYWLSVCKRYKEMTLHLYEDHLLVQLVERSGQILTPAVLPYTNIELANNGRCDCLAVYHPLAAILVPISDHDINRGDYDGLTATVYSGKRRSLREYYASGCVPLIEYDGRHYRPLI